MGLKLLDYHRLRSEEERSWDRDRLRQEAGSAFISAAEALLPTHEEKWAPDKLVHFAREPWFESCLQLCDLYANGTGAQRTWLRSRIDHNIGGKLGLFGLRAAILGARQHSHSLARASLTAYAIKDLGGDIRDVLIGFALLCHCAALAGVDVPTVYREIAGISGSAMRALYEEWADRYPNVQQIGSMAWREIHTDEGIGFRQG